MPPKFDNIARMSAIAASSAASSSKKSKKGKTAADVPAEAAVGELEVPKNKRHRKDKRKCTLQQSSAGSYSCLRRHQECLDL